MTASVQLIDFKKKCMLQLLLGKQPVEQLVYSAQGKTHLSFSPAAKNVTPPFEYTICIPSAGQPHPASTTTDPAKLFSFRTNTHLFVHGSSTWFTFTVANEEKPVYHIKMVFTLLVFLNFPFKHY